VALTLTDIFVFLDNKIGCTRYKPRFRFWCNFTW